jgi:sec-independent protein translocase protein TatB
MLSIPHLIIIFLVALVVFGPQKLPELARTLGKLMAEFRKATGDLRSTFDEHMRELELEAQRLDLQKRELELARQQSQQRAQQSNAPPQQSLLPAAVDQSVQPGNPQQAELPLDGSATPAAAPPETVPRGRGNSGAGPNIEPDSSSDGH